MLLQLLEGSCERERETAPDQFIPVSNEDGWSFAIPLGELGDWERVSEFSFLSRVSVGEVGIRVVVSCCGHVECSHRRRHELGDTGGS